LEVIDQGSCSESHPAPLLFVHGAWHVAWCWNENFLGFFADKGFRAARESAEGQKESQYRKALEDIESRRCVAHNREGERCSKWAILGSTVCATHGGSTKHIKEKARQRVELASNRLMGKLIEIAFR
jgi:hypothetical protein